LDPLKEGGMIARLVTALIAGALTLPAASAQTPSAAPDPAALELARLLMSRDESLYDDADLGRFRSRILNALLGMEGTCNARMSECQAAAAEIAAQYAPVLRRTARERSERLTAASLAATLRPEEMARIAAWLRGDEGRHFLDAWGSLHDPDHIRDRRRLVEGDLAQSAPEIYNPARALFRQRSRNLPQPAPR
jgi:hypothetical protein